jgi:hypothetical protein
MIKRQILIGLAVIFLSAVPTARAQAGFGFTEFGVTFTNADGTVDTQAGSHPFAMSTSFALGTRLDAFGEEVPDGDVRDITVKLPPGVVGSAIAVPRCSQELFTRAREDRDYNKASCPEATAVGVAAVALPAIRYVSVYSLVPPPGVPAEFGFNITGVPVVLVPSIRTGEDYGLTVESKYTSQVLRVFGAAITLWGVPGDPRHNGIRGGCLDEYTGESRGEECGGDSAQKPFLTLPTSCGGPLTSVVTADSWLGESATGSASTHDEGGDPLSLDGCNRLDFSPSLSAQIDATTTSAPTGLTVDLRLPQNENPAGLSEADVQTAVVRLPAGLSVNPAAADGLGACTPGEVGLQNNAAAACPDASKIGSVVIRTPLLEAPLTGGVYLAQQSGKFNPLTVYVIAEGSGVLVKLEGRIAADETTGQLTSTFENTPQLPFGELELHLFGGVRAPLVSPATCGTYTTTGVLTPWTSAEPAAVADAFGVSNDCGKAPSVSFVAGTSRNQAGGFGGFTTTVARTDQDQEFKEISVRLPPGLLGMLSQLSPCREPQAALGACPPTSQVGHISVGAGAGPNPVFLPMPGMREDPVFLTGPYKGAPFGLVILVHAEAGPFNLGDIPVRATISVDPHTAQVTITSDPLPIIKEGVPLLDRTINVTADREHFVFNPTSCAALSVGGTVSSTEGASVSLSSRFQAANCGALAFKPSFHVSTEGSASRQGRGASLTVVVRAKGGPLAAHTEANIGKVDLQLPKVLPARLSTLQRACTSKQFESNPAGCPSASNIGRAEVRTPVLSHALIGPGYIVSHGGAAFPDVEFVLQGEGITFILDGATDIKKAVTYSRFRAVPDVPISFFEARLPEGPHSILASTKGKLCGQKLVMPMTITGQNGAVVRESDRVAVTGCRHVTPKRKKPKVKKGKH